MANKKRRKRKLRKKPRIIEPKRIAGFHCIFCREDMPFNERFVPMYYQAPEGHRLYPHVCYSCHLEGADRNGHGKRAEKPKLNVDTLEQFFLEDVSDGAYDAAAADFFDVAVEEIHVVMEQIKV